MLEASRGLFAGLKLTLIPIGLSEDHLRQVMRRVRTTKGILLTCYTADPRCYY
jgi:hypothetical protein